MTRAIRYLPNCPKMVQTTLDSGGFSKNKMLFFGTFVYSTEPILKQYNFFHLSRYLLCWVRMECTCVEIADLDIFVWQDFLLKIQLRAHAPYLEISKKILGLWNAQEHLSLCQFSRCEVLFRWPAEPAAAACSSIVPVSMLCENTRVTQFTKVPILAETMATYCEAGRCLFIFTPLDKQTRRQPFCFWKDPRRSTQLLLGNNGGGPTADKQFTAGR